MRKSFLIALLCICTNGLLKAQTFSAHILAGAATSQVSGDQLAGFNKAGVMAGAGVNARLSKKADLGFEIYYIQKGSLKQSNIDKGDFEYYRLRLNYFEVPLLLKFHLTDKLGIEVGPSIATLISSKEEDENGELPGRKEFIKYEVSVVGGLVYHFGSNWGLQLRGEQSISPIRTHSGGGTYRLNRGQYNSVLLFALFYQFGKGRS